MEYPRLIELESDKLKNLLIEKSELVTSGRLMSQDIEIVEADLQEIDNQMKELEKTVDITEFQAEESEITKRMEACIAEMEGIQSRIKAKMIEKIPKELGDRYDELKNKKESLETGRNKIALKVQKYNDKIIPLGRKLMKPYLVDNFDDYETIMIEDGVIKATIFNHLEEFKTSYNKKKK